MSTTLSADTATVTFSAIPQTFTDLLIKISTRTTRATSTNDGLMIKLNATTTPYSSRSLTRDDGSIATYGDLFGVGYVINTASAGVTASIFASSDVYIANYAGSNHKLITSETVVETNAPQNRLENMVNIWTNTDAITSIVFGSYGSSNLVQYSTYTLYGIKSS
jgi:hypothetical protein